MISAREFCRESGYPITVLLTYSFDPLFFERVALTDLQVGGTRRIAIVGDGHQINDAINRCVGQLAHLGRRYLLAETAIPNTFHPKLIARLSPEGGRVWVGSGNLTYTGWGGNREVAAAWLVGPGQEDDGVWLSELFEAVGGFAPSATLAAQLDIIRNLTPWLAAPGDDLQERLLCGRQLGTVVTARKQVAVSIHGHHNGGMPEPRLHDLRRQFKTAVLARIDAPGGIKVPQCMQASVLGREDWFATLIHD